MSFIDRFHKPERRRLNSRTLTVIVIGTLIVSYMIAWDRTKGNQKRLDRAVTLMSERRFDESHELFVKVLKRWPRAKLALVGKGLCELNLGQYEEALASYDRILDIEPDNLQGLQGKGMSYEKLLRYDEAIECYRRINELKPGVFGAREQIIRLTMLKSAGH